jgi:hypothetical protein
MKNILFFFSIIGLSFFVLSPVLASSDLDSFITSLNVEARADLGAFKIRLSTQFGVPVPTVEAVIASVGAPGDAYMCFRVGQVASKPVEIVTKEYQAHKGQGWGVIAKNLGIKPGSKEFHALKERNIKDGNASAGKGKGKK